MLKADLDEIKHQLKIRLWDKKGEEFSNHLKKYSLKYYS